MTRRDATKQLQQQGTKRGVGRLNLAVRDISHSLLQVHDKNPRKLKARSREEDVNAVVFAHSEAKRENAGAGLVHWLLHTACRPPGAAVACDLPQSAPLRHVTQTCRQTFDRLTYTFLPPLAAVVQQARKIVSLQCICRRFLRQPWRCCARWCATVAFVHLL